MPHTRAPNTTPTMTDPSIRTSIELPLSVVHRPTTTTSGVTRTPATTYASAYRPTGLIHDSTSFENAA